MINNRLERALAAYNTRNVEASKKAHEKEEIEKSLHGSTFGGKYLADFVYGALDGTVTTFAVVAAVAGASLSASIVIILGLANLLGDGFSMATGNYLSTKSQIEFHREERKREEWEIENVPDGEREEIRQIYRKKGFRGKELERVVKVITSDRKVWIDTMMMEELNIAPADKKPWQSALATFVAFVVVGFVPLISYVLAMAIPAIRAETFAVSIVLTAIVLFVVGTAKVLVTKRNWLRSGIEMLFVGGAAALVAYLVGFFLKTLGV
jgi:VIT1/CCC1 family predicted Fe2+/Mn2+ transporter